MANKYVEPLLEESVYADVFDHLAHYSLKLTNSNTKGAIRVDKAYAKAVPYAALCSALAHGADVLTDYFRGAADAKAFKHLRFALSPISMANVEEAARSSTDAPPTKIKKEAEDLKYRHEAKLHFAPVLEIYNKRSLAAEVIGVPELNARLPQLLIPKGGDYLSVTPSASSSFGLHLHEIKKSVARNTRSATRSIGGANTQNIGGLTYTLHSAVIAPSPREDQGLRKAIAMLNRGVNYSIPKGPYTDYLGWRESLIHQKKTLDHDRRTKDQDQAMALNLLLPYLSALRAARKEIDALEQDIEHVVAQASQSEHRRASSNIISRKAVTKDDIAALASHICTRIATFGEDRKIGWDEHDRKHFGKLFAEKLNEL